MIAVAAVSVLAASACGTEASPDDGMVFSQDGIVYETRGGFYNYVELIGVTDGFDAEDLVVPETVTHDGMSYRVTYVAPEAFKDQTSLVSVHLPETIHSLGNGAFSGCTSLSDINIPYSVTNLEETFAGCTSLEKVILSGNYYTTELRGTFQGCTSLREVSIPWTVTVGDDTFAGCDSLEYIDIGRASFVGDDAFSGCSSLTELRFSKDITLIGDRAFEDCTSLRAVTIPETDGLVIEEEAFSGCTDLESVYIGDGVEVVGDRAFEGCHSISVLTFLSVCEIGESVFAESGSIETAHIHSQTLLESLDHGNALVSLTLGGDVVDLSPRTVPSLLGLRTLVLEDGVRTVDVGTFDGSRNLELVAIPHSLEAPEGPIFDVDGECLVAGNREILDSVGIGNPIHGNLVTYNVTGMPGEADRLEYDWAVSGEWVTPGYHDRGGYTVEVSLDGDDAEEGFEMPSHDVNLDVTYHSDVRRILFYDENILVDFQRLHLGDQIQIPETPYRYPTVGYDYEFRGWVGLEPGMVVKESTSFHSDFVRVLTDEECGEAADGFLCFDWNSEAPVRITSDMASRLLSSNISEGLDGVSFSFETGWITLGNDDLSLISDEGVVFETYWTFNPTSRHHVTAEGSDGSVTFDVDLGWMSSNRITVVSQIGPDGELTEIESTTAWHDGFRFVRFTVTDSGDYFLDNGGPLREIPMIAIHIGAALLLGLLAVVSVVVISRRA